MDYDYDALTGKGGDGLCDDTETVLEKKKRSLVVRSRTRRDQPCCRCSKKCFVVSSACLFLLITFITLPAGAFLIIHGNRNDLMAFKLAGALVVAFPVVIGFLFCLTLCLRRKWTHGRLTFNTSNAEQI